MSLADLVIGIFKIVFWPVIVLFDILTDPVIGVLTVTAIATILGLCFAILASPALAVSLAIVIYLFGLATYMKSHKDHSTAVIFWKVVCDGLLLGIVVRYLGYLA